MYKRLAQNLGERIAYTYRRAASAMLVTTCNNLLILFKFILVTTTFSFLATAFSPVYFFL